MKQILLLFAALACCLSAPAQVTVLPMPYQESGWSLDNIWNVTLVQAQSGSLAGSLEVTLETADHQPVLSAVSPVFTLQQGQNRPAFRAGSTGIHYGTTPKAALLRQVGRLPYGHYILCYRFVASSTGVILGEYCSEETSRPFGPPELIFPFDREEVPTGYPLLSWKPPFPPGVAPVDYTLILKQIKDGQTAPEALERNIPMVSRNRLSGTVLPYPDDAPNLEDGKRYVWQVIARAGNFELGATEIWEFTVQLPAIPEMKPSLIHYEYTSDDQDRIPFVMAGDTLGVVVDHAYEHMNNFNLTITSQSQQDLAYSVKPYIETSSRLAAGSLHPGTNYFVVLLNRLGLETGERYLLTARDQKTTYYLSFLYEGQ